MQPPPPHKTRKKNFLRLGLQYFFACRRPVGQSNETPNRDTPTSNLSRTHGDKVAENSEQKTMESDSNSMSKRTKTESVPSWRAPMFPGLHNSPRIIPEYYTSTHLKNGILKINYYDMMIDDIRNLRPLSIDQLQYIKKRRLTPQEYYHLICEYNQVVCALIETL
jgi:hypothetical protein